MANHTTYSDDDDRVKGSTDGMHSYGHAAKVYGPVRRVSWGAVFAGVILAVVLQLLLSMLGTGIGMSTVDPLQNDTPGAAAFGIGAGIWWAVSSLVALFIGGWIAGHLAGIPRSMDGALHGLLVWGLGTLLMVYLLGSAVGSVMRGASGLLGAVANTAASGVSVVAPQLAEAAKEELAESGITMEDVKREVTSLLRQTGQPALQPEAIEQKVQQATDSVQETAQDAAVAPRQSDDELDSLLQKLMNQAEATVSQADKDAVVNVLVARTGMSREEAQRSVDNWLANYRQAQAELQQAKEEAKQKARQVADATAENVARAALWGSLALLLGAIAAAFGGAVGRPRHALPIEDSRA